MGVQIAPDFVAPAHEDDDWTPADTELWDARSSLGAIHRWARARRVSPWALLGVSLARVVAATPPTVVLPPIIGSRASLNLFVGLVGPPASGKSAAIELSDEVLSVSERITVLKLGSGEGIAHSYMRRAQKGGAIEQHTTSVLFTVPEIDSLTALGSRKGATLMPELRSAWTGEPLGFGYADPTKRLPVPRHRYRLCLVAGIQPGRATALLADADAGTPQRFLWLPATDPDAPDERPQAPRGIAWQAPVFGRMASKNSAGQHEMDVCQRACDTIEQAQLARLHGDLTGLDGHGLLNRLKTAAALALLEGNTGVGDDDWDLAGLIASRSDRTRESVQATLATATRDANLRRAESEAQRQTYIDERTADTDEKRIARLLLDRGIDRKAGPDGWATWSDIRRAVSKKDRGVLEGAISRLLDAGQIEEERDGKASRYRVLGGRR